MFSTPTSEDIFITAWETGYICLEDWLVLTSEVVDENTYAIAARLMHAVRRGRLTVIR